jgi:hypothetical protein
MNTINLNNLERITLDAGAHNAPEDGHCLLEVVSMMSGEPFSDSPACCCPTLAAFGRRWNDDLPDTERQQLKQYIPQLLGSRGSDALALKRGYMAGDWLVRVCTPAWLDLKPELQAHAAGLRALAPITCEQTLASAMPALGNAQGAAAAAWDAARDAAWAAARDAAWAAARDAAWAAAWAAARAAARAAAWAAARDAAWAAARAAAWAAARDAAWDAARDAAWDAARDAAPGGEREAADAALKPVREALQASAHNLFAQMIAATEPEAA